MNCSYYIQLNSFCTKNNVWRYRKGKFTFMIVIYIYINDYVTLQTRSLVKVLDQHNCAESIVPPVHLSLSESDWFSWHTWLSCPCLCPAVYAHRLGRTCIRGGTVSEALSAWITTVQVIISFPVWFQFKTGMTIIHHQGDMAASLLVRKTDDTQYKYNARLSLKGKENSSAFWFPLCSWDPLLVFPWARSSHTWLSRSR